RVEAEGGSEPLPRYPGQCERDEEEQEVDSVPRCDLLAGDVAGRRTLAAREVEEELCGAAAAALERLQQPTERAERVRPPQPEDLLRVLEGERVADVLVEVGHVRPERGGEEEQGRQAGGAAAPEQ